MELVIGITAMCITAAILALTVKRGTPELALLLVLAAAVAAIVSVGQALGELMAFVRDLGRQSGVSDTLMEPLYKTVAISLVVKIGGGLCADAGESALGAAVETAGTVCALCAALPLFRSVLTLLTELMA